VNADRALVGSTAAAVGWPGLIAAYADRIAVPTGAKPVTLLEGGTPLLPAPALSDRVGAQVWLKVEGANPTGSFKDRGMTCAVSAAVREGIDIIAVSFVSTAADLTPVTQRLRSLGSDIPLVAKIERAQAAVNIEEIAAAASGGIMVARGDLGIEVPLAEVPVLQKRLIRTAGRQSKPVVTATQMLASMVTARRPTRAEVTDVANAIYDGTDAIMLSEETAVGENPVEAVRVMDRIARATEPDLRYGEWLFSRTDQATQDVADSVAQSAVGAVYRLGLKALVVPTTSGRTARILSAHRPNVPVLAISPRLETVRRLSLLFGVTAVLGPPNEDIRGLLEDCATIAAKHGVAHSGELIGITAGLPDQELGTNLFEVHRVP